MYIEPCRILAVQKVSSYKLVVYRTNNHKAQFSVCRHCAWSTLAFINRHDPVDTHYLVSSQEPLVSLS